MLTIATHGLGSVSGVVHLAARRPYIVAVAAVALAAFAFTNSATHSVPALAPPPVPAAPVVQHTPRPPVTMHEHGTQHALGQRENPAAKQQLAVKQQPEV
jgi:hypothetical protein